MSKLEVTQFVFFSILIIFILVPSFYWTYTNKQIKRIENKSIFLDWRFWIPALTYTFVLGFRWDYAYDWDQYYNTFNDIQHGILYRETTEKGYLAINLLLGKLGFNFYSIFILEGFIYIVSIYTLLQKNRRVLLFALPLIYIAARHNCLNISRQFFAQSFMWIGLYHLINGKKKWYFIWGILACSIHTSAYIWFIAFYFIKYIKLPSLKTSIIIYSCCFCLSVIIQEYLIVGANLLTTYIITNKEYDSTALMADRFIREGLPLSRMLITGIQHFTYFITSYYLIQKLKVGSYFEHLLITIGTIGTYTIIITGNHEIFDRFFWYISYLYYIGWGITLFYITKYRKQVPSYIILLNTICLIRMLWGMHSTIIEEVLKSQHYIEYKII